MFKNVASQKIAVFAYDTSAQEPKTGDSANITAYISKDGGAGIPTNDTNPVELDAANMKGVYIFDMTQAETYANLVTISPSSSTSDITLEPIFIYTVTVMRGTDGANTTVPDAAGTAPTAVENRQEMDSNSTQLAAIVEDTGTTLENRQIAILEDVTGINGDAMRGTDGANTTVPLAAAVDQANSDQTQTDIGNLNDIAATDIVSGGAIATSLGAVSEVDEIIGNVAGNVIGNVVGYVGSVVAAVETDAASRTASKATGFATEAKQDIIDTNVDTLITNENPDETLDVPNGTLTKYAKGTANVISTKDLYDPDDNAVNSTEDIIAKSVEQ